MGELGLNGEVRMCRELPARVQVAEAMTARRDAVLHLQTVLADDLAQYEGGIAAVRAGLAKDILVPAVGGSIRAAPPAAISRRPASSGRTSSGPPSVSAPELSSRRGSI